MEFLEALVIELEGKLLDSLTTEQFALVQELQIATEALTAARCATAQRRRIGFAPATPRTSTIAA